MRVGDGAHVGDRVGDVVDRGRDRVADAARHLDGVREQLAGDGVALEAERSSRAASSSGARGTRSPVSPSASMSSHSRPTEERADVAKGTVMRTVWHADAADPAGSRGACVIWQNRGSDHTLDPLSSVAVLLLSFRRVCTPLSRRPVRSLSTHSGESWLSRSVSSASARSVRRTTASSWPTRAPSAMVVSSRRSASTTPPRSPRSSRSTPSVRSTGCRVGAQPTEQVTALLKLTGDWGKFKGDKNAVSTVKTREEPSPRSRSTPPRSRSSSPRLRRRSRLRPRLPRAEATDEAAAESEE